MNKDCNVLRELTKELSKESCNNRYDIPLEIFSGNWKSAEATCKELHEKEERLKAFKPYEDNKGKQK